MVIENRWFVFSGFRRADLSGRPWGFLFIWKPRDYPMKWQPATRFVTKGGVIDIAARWTRDGPRFAPLPSSPVRVGIFLDEWRRVPAPRSLQTVGSEKYGWYERRRVPIPRFRFGAAA